MTGPDLNMLDLSQEAVQTDNVSAEDFFRRLAPMDDGEHECTAKMAERGIEVKPRKTVDGVEKPAFLMVNVQFTTLDDGSGKPSQTCFDNPNSVVFTTQTGQRTSRLHVFLDALGAPFQGSNLQELKDWTEQTLAQNPRVGVRTKWEAQIETDKSGKDKYKVVKAGQKNFPQMKDAEGNPTGEYNPVVTDPQTGKEATARAQVQGYRKV